ncbi:MAG: AMP-binding protein [Spirochaetales bacterium]|nr:AMP-binding protein [Spirochaetales bacterium]
MKDLNFNTFGELYKTCISLLDPSKTILIFNDTSISTSELMEQVEKYTWCFHKIGVRKGTRVAYSLPDCLEIYYITIALSNIGASAIPIHHLVPSAQKSSIIRFFNAQFLISDARQVTDHKREFLKNNVESSIITLEKNEESDYSIAGVIEEYKEEDYPESVLEPDDPLFAIASSGTTGIPKFVEITQRNMVNVVKATRFFMEPVSDFKNDFKILCAFPMSTSSILTLLAELFFRKTTILLDNYSPLRFLSLIEQYKVDALAATPAYYEAIINLPVINNYALDSVKRVYSGMDFLPNKRLQKIKKIFKNLRIAGIGYGLTETSSVIMVWQAFKESDFDIPTNYFTPIPGIGNEIKIIDSRGKSAAVNEEGEVIIKGYNVIKEYYKNQDETKQAFTKDGWLLTGDLGRKDEMGRIQILGRMKYVIKRGGRSVSPVVINNHLLSHNSIYASAVVGIPHDMYGEMIWAFICPEKGRNITTGEIMKYCREGLPPYMIPDHITFIDRLPQKGGVGKIDSEELINIAKKELLTMTGGKNEQ